MDVSATHLRHPLACKKFMMEFESRGNNDLPTPSSGQAASGESTRLQPFELFSRYTAVRPIASGTYGFVIAARDAKEVEAWHALPLEERTPDPDDGLDAETLYDQKTLVAIKKVPQLFESGIPRMWLCAAREAQMLMHFQHENVISARDVFIPLGPEHLATADTIRMRSKTFEDFYVVMDYKELTLRDVLRRAALTADDTSSPRSTEEAESPTTETPTTETPTGSSSQRQAPRLCAVTREPLCPLPQEYRQFLLYQLLRGVGYMHACRVMHRDLKPENVLVDLNYKLCICDFGQAKDLNEAVAVAETEADAPSDGSGPNMTVLNNCTQWYAAPETLTLIPEQTGDSGVIEEDSLHSADVWSIGAIAAEMILGRPVFHTPSRGGFPQLRAITQVRGRITPADAEALSSGRHNEDRISYVQELSRKAAAREQCDFKSFLRNSCPLEDTDDDELELVAQLLAYDPKARPTPQAAIAHVYFTKSEYEPIVDPDNNAKPLRTASKDSIRTADDARMLFWDLFLSFHGEVKQLVEVLSAQKAMRAQGRK